ncbi:MAG TPA: hypothetical protein VFQ50_03125, partial [Flavobacterium sp.]|nr:hypothetical protein [Flavobacterium sp.]
RQISKPEAVAANDTVQKITVASADEIIVINDASKSRKETDQSAGNAAYLTTRKHEARGVQRLPNMMENSAPQKDVVQKPNPLLVVEGNVVPEGKKYDRTLKEALTKAENADEEIVVLKEPLYIINGIYYSEDDLFGEKPTSPYAPLNKQEIETITILQGEKATAIYGAKGSKGVVIITTKNRKPADAIKGN